MQIFMRPDYINYLKWSKYNELQPCEIPVRIVNHNIMLWVIGLRFPSNYKKAKQVHYENIFTEIFLLAKVNRKVYIYQCHYLHSNNLGCTGRSKLEEDASPLNNEFVVEFEEIVWRLYEKIKIHIQHSSSASFNKPIYHSWQSCKTTYKQQWY